MYVCVYLSWERDWLEDFSVSRAQCRVSHISFWATNLAKFSPDRQITSGESVTHRKTKDDNTKRASSPKGLASKFETRKRRQANKRTVINCIHVIM